MKKIILLSILLPLFFTNLFAQEEEVIEDDKFVDSGDLTKTRDVKNVAKLGILSLSYRRINLNYERAFNEKMTLNVQVGLQIPRSFPSLENNNQSESQRINGVDYNAFGITPTLRFYPKDIKDAPRGFYFGPYLSHNYNAFKFFVEYDDSDTGQTHDAVMDVDMNGTGLGFTIGTQWLINDRISIDWNYFGIGLAYQALNIQYISDDPNADYQEIKNDIDAELSDAPYWGNKITTEASNSSLTAKVKNISPMFRTSLTIGYAF